MSDPYAGVGVPAAADPYAGVGVPMPAAPAATPASLGNQGARGALGSLEAMLGQVMNATGLGAPYQLALKGQQALFPDQAPRNGPEQVARTLGGMAPNAMLPGSLPGRIANVVVPTATAETARYVAKRSGAGPRGQAVAAILGGVGGGMLAGMRAGAPEPAPDAGSSATPATPALPSLTPEEQTAAQSLSAVNPAMGPADIASAGEAPMTTAEALGPAAQARLGELGRGEGATGQALRDFLFQRRVDRPNRVLDTIQSATGIAPDAARGNVEAMVQAGQKAASPLFTAALSNRGPVWSPDLAALAQRPVIAKAIGQVADDVLNEGRNPMSLGLRLDPDTGWTVGGRNIDEATGGVTQPAGLAEVTEPQPTAETWDLVHKAIGKQIERNPITNKPVPDSQSTGNHGVTVATRDLTGVLRQAIPGYAEALDTSGDYLSAQSAFDRARGFLFGTARNRQPQDFTTFWNSLKSPAEQQAAKAGIAADIFDRTQNNQFSVSRTANNPAIMAKLNIAFGPEAARQIAQTLDREAQMAGFENRWGPNAQSATQPLQAARSANEAMAANPMLDMASDIANRGSAHKAIQSAIARPIVDAIDNAKLGRSIPIRDAAGRILMMPPDQGATYLTPSAPPTSGPGALASVRFQPGSAALASAILAAQTNAAGKKRPTPPPR